MSGTSLDALLESLRAGQTSRRAFVRGATAMGISAGAAGMIAQSALAQEASPAASPTGTAAKSITRDEYLASLREQVPFEEPESTGGQVILASTSDIATLNPVVRSDIIALYAINNIFSYLVRGNPIDGTLVPDLADYWEVGADGMTYTFHLSKDARWHDGEPVTAHDALMTFEAVMADGIVSPLGSEFTGSVASMRAVDDHTFEIVSKEPVALFLEKTVSAIAIMPAHIWGDIPHGEWAASPGSTGTDPSQVIGSGPFKFTEWVLGDHVTIERNDDYWLPDLVPNIDTFTIRVIADPESAVQSVITGESDTMRGLAPSQMDRFDGVGDVEILTYDTMSFTSFVMNADTEKGLPFAETDVRRALMYAVDREMIVESMLMGAGTPAIGVQPPTSPAYAPDRVNTVYTYDPERAASILEEAGWVDSDGDGVREKDGTKFSVEYIYGESSPLNEQLVPYLQQAFRDVGVDLVPRSGPVPTINEQITGGDYAISNISITWDLDDQGVLYRCDAFPPVGFNLPRHCNPEYDRLNDASILELDPEKRRELIIEQGNVSNDDAHYGILYFGRSVVPVNTRLHNAFHSAHGDFWSLAYVWVTEE